MREIGEQLRAQSDDVHKVIELAMKETQKHGNAARSNQNKFYLTALDGLDWIGSCTSNANMLATILRAAGIPARILSGIPIWSGLLQQHYIVEAYLPNDDWYPVEPTIGRAGWSPHYQINKAIINIDYEIHDFLRANYQNPSQWPKLIDWPR